MPLVMMMPAASTITIRRLVLSIIFLSISSATRLPTLHFADYVPTESYRASSFLNASVDDKVMKAVYRTVNVFIASIARPLPHQSNQHCVCFDHNLVFQRLSNEMFSWVIITRWCVHSPNAIPRCGLFTRYYWSDAFFSGSHSISGFCCWQPAVYCCRSFSPSSTSSICAVDVVAHRTTSIRNSYAPTVDTMHADEWCSMCYLLFFCSQICKWDVG